MASAAQNYEYWTFEAVEQRLIEAMRFAWRDEPGKFPFAGDGPWSLIRPDQGDYSAKGVDGKDDRVIKVPLTRAERRRMDDAVAWLGYVQRGEDRIKGGDARLMVFALRKLAAHRGEGRGVVPWMRLLPVFGVKRGAGMLHKRYSRAVSHIAKQLDKDGIAVEYARH